MAYNLFAHAEPELVSWLRSSATPVALAEETCIVREGSRDDGLYIVDGGRVRIATTAADGASVHLADQGAGSMLGEMSWLESRPAVASVWAEPGSRLLHLSCATLEALTRDGQPVAAQLYRAIGSKLSLQIQSQNAWIHRFPASLHEPLRKVLVLFAELNEQDVDWLRQLGQLRRLPAGGLLINEGEPVHSLALILAGEARIQVFSEGRLQTVGSSRRGELLGEMSLINQDGRGASARVDTLEGLELLSLAIDPLLAALACDAVRATRFWRALARMLSQRSRDQLLQRGLAATSRQAEARSDDGASDDGEIGIAQLSGISTAGARFDWLCRQFQSQQG